MAYTNTDMPKKGNMNCYYLPEQVFHSEKDTLLENEKYKAIFGLSDTTFLYIGSSRIIPKIEINGETIKDVRNDGTIEINFVVKKENKQHKYEKHEVVCYITFPHPILGDIRYTCIDEYWIK